MFLYHLKLARGGAITTALYGNFSGPKAQEIVVARGSVLELLRPDENGKVETILSVEAFGIIRSLAAFRLPSGQKDYIVMGSDSGRIVVLEYNKVKNIFERTHTETYGKSGCRRIVPGQYVAADPKGRAVMVAAVEKNKLVYVFNRDAAARLTISSPLEANKSSHLTFAMCALDCGFENPVFAAIELDYSDADLDPSGVAATEAQKHLTYYELDLGLNHVSRKWTEAVDNGANMVVAVPGDTDGPGGVLVCAENFVIYKHEGHADVRAVIPRRTELPADRGVLLVAHTMHKLKSGGTFFMLLQSEYGDLYKATLVHSGAAVSELKLQYFDTIPVCTSLCVLRTGFLFAASESGNSSLYQFQALGEDGDVESSSATLLETEEGFQPVFFEPRPLRNLLLVDDVDSLAPIVDMKAANLTGEETPQIYVACGRGPRSSLRALRQGLAVTEMAVSPLPGNPNAVWTVRRQRGDEHDAYIVVSFVNATLVLSIGATVEEVADSGFLGTTPSLLVGLLGADALLQVHPNGLRHIRGDKRINEWKAPGRKLITKVGANSKQVVVALTGGELIYFELNEAGQLMDTDKKDMPGDVACLDVSPVPDGRLRARFLAVASYDSTIRILSLEPDDCMQQLGLLQIGAPAESLLMLEFPTGLAGGEGAAGGVTAAMSLFLHAGLANGVLLRAEVDRVSGSLTDTRTRFLGGKPPRLCVVVVRGAPSLLALSTRPWLGYTDAGRYVLQPLSYEALEHASGFASEQCAEGLVAVSAASLRIITLDRLGETFNASVTRLRYTPRRFLVHPQLKVLLVAEADHNTAPAAGAAATGAVGGGGDAMALDGDAGAAAASAAAMVADAAEAAAEAEAMHGRSKPGPGRWASCLRVVDPRTLSTRCVLELAPDEAALCLALVTFQGREAEGTLLAVGVTTGLTFLPRACVSASIHLYRLTAPAPADGSDPGAAPPPATLELLHKTPVDGIPGALCAFQGKLLAGVGAALRLYELGQKKLLRKCEARGLPNMIVTLAAQGDRVYVGDVQESFHYFKYKRGENQMYVFADDLCPRWVTAALPLDYDTMAGADKFGNLFLTRLPPELSDEVEEDPSGGRAATAVLGGAPNKLEDIVQFHLGEPVLALQRATLQTSGVEVLLYGGVGGSLGALVPFSSREDVDFFSHLEMHMRQEHPPLSGRDHMAYRSSFFPVKDVVDGDLCEQYHQLPADVQRRIAAELERTPGEVLRKIEDMRTCAI